MVNKLHDAVWENSDFTSADISMLGYGCGVSQYHQFYDKELFIYQLLPRPYKGYFEVFPGYKFVKIKWLLHLAYQAEEFVW